MPRIDTQNSPMSNARMNGQLSDRMTEAEVSLRLAEYILSLPGLKGRVDVAIDGAGVFILGLQVFDIDGFLAARSWKMTASEGKNRWTGTYKRDQLELHVHSRSGVGDVVATVGAVRLVAECKKGWLVPKKGSPERPLLATALGQALLLKVTDADLVIAAVPNSEANRKIATQWRNRPLVRKAGIRICLVGQDGKVDGLSDLRYPRDA